MFQLSDAAQTYLLKVARTTISVYLKSKTKPDIPLSPLLEVQQKRGVFVTLYRNEKLCGCVGYVHSLTPLVQGVAECVLSAVEDNRFMQLKFSELSAVKIELSVLSEFEKIKFPSEIEIGRHGLIVSYGSSRGLLLPKVATENGWNQKKFLEETCYKAGLPLSVWKNGADLERFTALVFRES